MKKIITISLAMLSFNANAYVESQLKQYESTGTCIGCDLTHATIVGRHHANLSGSIFTNATLKGEFWFSDFVGTDFSSSLTQIKATLSNFTNAKFDGASLVGSDFSNGDFTGASFLNADLTMCDFTGAKVTFEQLIWASALYGTIMPDGRTHD